MEDRTSATNRPWSPSAIQTSRESVLLNPVQSIQWRACMRGTKLPFSRRNLIQLGGLGMIGLGLPELLAASSAPGRRERSCIFLVQYGGASHHDSFDLKP